MVMNYQRFRIAMVSDNQNQCFCTKETISLALWSANQSRLHRREKKETFAEKLMEYKISIMDYREALELSDITMYACAG